MVGRSQLTHPNDAVLDRDPMSVRIDEAQKECGPRKSDEAEGRRVRKFPVVDREAGV